MKMSAAKRWNIFEAIWWTTKWLQDLLFLLFNAFVRCQRVSRQILRIDQANCSHYENLIKLANHKTEYMHKLCQIKSRKLAFSASGTVHGKWIFKKKTARANAINATRWSVDQCYFSILLVIYKHLRYGWSY